MSLLSREHLVIGFAPEQLSALHLTGPKQRVAQHFTPLQQADNIPWSSGIDALEILLDDPAWGGRNITLVLSNHYVRYAVIPQGQALAARELNDLARLVFRNTFGDLAHDWELRVSPGKTLRTLASAVPQALLSALHIACEGRGTLRSIQPGLMGVFNRIRPTIANDAGTLALVEPGRITLARIDNGQWVSVDSRAGTASALPERLDETSILSGPEFGHESGHNAAGMAGGRLWLADLTGKARPPSSPPWHLERVMTAGNGIHDAPSLADWGIQ